MWLHVASSTATLVAAVVVPSAVPTIIVVPQNQGVLGNPRVFRLLNIAHAVELLANLSLNNLVLLILLIACFEVEMQLVVSQVSPDVLVFLHMERDGQDPAETEVGVLDVFPVDFLVYVKQVRVLELLNGFVGDLADPVVHPETAVFQDHLLQIVEFVSPVVIRVERLQQLCNVFLGVHNLVRLRDSDSLHHDLGSRALLNSQQGEQVLEVDFLNQAVQLDVVVQVLTSSTTRQVHKLIAVTLAFVTQFPKDILNISFFQQTDRRIL